MDNEGDKHYEHSEWAMGVFMDKFTNKLLMFDFHW